MGKAPIETMVGREVHGRVDNVVYRQILGEAVLARRPRDSKKPVTDAQLAVRDRFGDAGRYAKAVFDDAARKQPYVDFAVRSNQPIGRLFSMIARDYLTPPRVKNIDTYDYHRHIGDEIRVLAEDDVIITKVHVKIARQSDGSLVEQGLATYYGPHWRYVATVDAPPAPEMLTFEVTPFDLAGNHPTETMGLRT